ncbi:hypothetical protein TNCV_2052511 [Trichonephila clavipes]|nr:hypothetical protein TNCV_2052511 [Trichonephila clavipes]
MSKGRESRGRSLPRSPSRTYKFQRPNTSSPGVQSIAGPSKLPDRRTDTTTGGSRMEVSGRDNQTRQTRATTRRHNEKAEKTVRSNQTNTKKTLPILSTGAVYKKKTESMRTSTTSKSTAYLAAYSAENLNMESVEWGSSA